VASNYKPIPASKLPVSYHAMSTAQNELLATIKALEKTLSEQGKVMAQK